MKQKISNSESKGKKTMKGWDPVFSPLSGETNKSMTSLVGLGKRGRK